MLGKLIQYEFKHTAKTMALTYAVLAAATLMGSAALYRLHCEGNGAAPSGSFLTVISVIMLLFYVIAIIAIYCVDFIYLCSNYYKTMYSAQGYLTHTLPVSPAASFGVKIFAMFVWMFVSTVLSALSFLVLGRIGSGGAIFNEFSAYAWNTFSEEVYAMFGISGGLLLFLFALSGLLGILLSILWIAASMAVGQLSQKNRTGFSILAAVAFYMANQIINTIFLAVSGYNLGSLLDGSASAFMKTVLWGSITMTIVFLVILYGICIYINKRKLNLE